MAVVKLSGWFGKCMLVLALVIALGAGVAFWAIQNDRLPTLRSEAPDTLGGRIAEAAMWQIDCLFSYKLTGHYRLPDEGVAAY